MNSTARFLSAAALVAASWAAGVFMGREPVVRDGTANSISTAAPAGVVESPSARVAETETPDARRGRVLGSLQSAIENRNPLRNSGSLAAAIVQIGPDEIQPALELARRQAGMGNAGILSLLFTRWGDFDPKAAAEFALSGDLGKMGPRIRGEALSSAVAAWARKEPAAAKAWALALPVGEDRQSAVASVVSGMAESDPVGAFAFLHSLPADAQRELSPTVFESCARRDPLMASQQALALPMGPDRDMMIATVASGWAKKDPKAAIDWIQSVADPKTRDQQVAGLLYFWAETDAAAAMEAALQLPLGGSRAQAVQSIVDVAAKRDPENARQLVNAIPEGPERDSAIRDAVSHLSNAAPAAAARLLSALPQGLRGPLPFSMFPNWARESPEDAANFVEMELPPGRPRREAALATAVAWAEENPRAAIEWFEKLGEPAEYFSENPAASLWASRDPQAALAWIASRPDGPRKAELLAGAIGGLAKHDPAQAAGLLESLPKRERYNPTIHVSREWTVQDPAGAVEWAEQITDPAVRDAAVPNVVRVLAESDVEQATAMLERLPEGRLRDEAIADFVSPAASTAPETAAAWAATIGDDQIRERAFSSLFFSWKTFDQPAARRRIEGEPSLSPEKKKAILNNLL